MHWNPSPIEQKPDTIQSEKVNEMAQTFECFQTHSCVNGKAANINVATFQRVQFKVHNIPNIVLYTTKHTICERREQWAFTHFLLKLLYL